MHKNRKVGPNHSFYLMSRGSMLTFMCEKRTNVPYFSNKHGHRTREKVINCIKLLKVQRPKIKPLSIHKRQLTVTENMFKTMGLTNFLDFCAFYQKRHNNFNF